MNTELSEIRIGRCIARLSLHSDAFAPNTGTQGETTRFVSSLVSIIRSSVPRTSGRGQRHEIVRLDLKQFGLKEGRAIVRKYLRGGLFGKFIHERFYFSGGSLDRCRPFAELAIVRDLYAANLPVPEPLGAVVLFDRNGMTYRGCIATTEIENARTLLEVLDEARPIGLGTDGVPGSAAIESLVERTGRLARDLIGAGVFHPDFHMGNVLITDDRLIAIDFDRSTRIGGSAAKNSAKNCMISRWSRACRRRKLPAWVERVFLSGLEGEAIK